MPDYSDSQKYIHDRILKQLENSKTILERISAEIDRQKANAENRTIISSTTEIKISKILVEISRLQKALSNPDIGVCIKCEKAIEISRLNANPSTNLCAKCAPPKQMCTVLPFIKKTS